MYPYEDVINLTRTETTLVNRYTGEQEVLGSNNTPDQIADMLGLIKGEDEYEVVVTAYRLDSWNREIVGARRHAGFDSGVLTPICLWGKQQRARVIRHARLEDLAAYLAGFGTYVLHANGNVRYQS